MRNAMKRTAMPLAAALLACAGGSDSPPDVSAPSIVSRTPASGDTEVSPHTAVTVVFDEPVDPASVTADTFKLYRAGVAVLGAVTVNGATAVFTPAADLEPLTQYLVNLSGGVRDLAGNAMSYAPSWTFTTGVTCKVVLQEGTAIIGNDTCTVTLTNGGGGMIWDVEATNLAFSGYMNWTYYVWPMEGTYSKLNTAEYQFVYTEFTPYAQWEATYSFGSEPDIGSATLHLTSVKKPDTTYIAHGTFTSTMYERGTTSAVTAYVVF